ncbi:MAG: M15 family metallopeptidase, partial [Hyphomicrobiaceae bacterium]
YGIAIDIATADADYWRWPAPVANGAPRPWRNRIPMEIVEIFERHGFIWGGKWHHYDTMHFEYRPELMPPAAPLP